MMATTSRKKNKAPRLKPLQQWICDTCREVIQEPKHGWLEWLRRNDRMAHGFRIVHHSAHSPLNSNREADPPQRADASCYRYDNRSDRQDNHLDRFIGADGMTHLLAFLDVGPYHDPDYRGPEVRSVREWTEIFRRLHVPYYEEARVYWEAALEDDFFSGGNEAWIYLPSTLKRLIEQYGNES